MEKWQALAPTERQIFNLIQKTLKNYYEGKLLRRKLKKKPIEPLQEEPFNVAQRLTIEKKYDSWLTEKQNINHLHEKAQSGNKQAFYKLVEKDKMFLFKPWARKMVMDAEINQDRLFFEKLSDSIKKFPKKSPKEDALTLIKKILEFDNNHLGMLIYSDKKALRAFYDAIYKSQGLGFNEILPAAWKDKRYFYVYLERHGLKAKTSKRVTVKK